MKKPMFRKVRVVDRGRGPQLDNCRVTIYDIIPFMEAGDSTELIAASFLISSNEVFALKKYIEEHHDEVMEVHRKIEERIARGNPPELEAKLRESHKKLMALKRKLNRERKTRGFNGARNSRR